MVLSAVPVGIFTRDLPQEALALALHNFISITVSVILLGVKIFVTPPQHVLNFAMRVIWTVMQGIAIIVLTVQAISPGLIYPEPKFDHSSLDGIIWVPGLIIITPMFIYGIVESWNIYAVCTYVLTWF